MIELFKDIGVRIDMQQGDRLAVRKFSSAQSLHNAAGNGVITTDGNRIDAGVVEPANMAADALDTGLVVVGLWERYIANVDN